MESGLLEVLRKNGNVSKSLSKDFLKSSYKPRDRF
jgi:hypothetical protein